MEQKKEVAGEPGKGKATRASGGTVDEMTADRMEPGEVGFSRERGDGDIN